jgi:hypothetical protein
MCCCGEVYFCRHPSARFAGAIQQAYEEKLNRLTAELLKK